MNSFRALTMGELDHRDKRIRLVVVEQLNESDDETVSGGYVSDDGSEASFASEQQLDESAGATTSPPASFMCPLTLGIMFDPVLDNEGNTYERAAIEKWLKDHKTSPISRCPLNSRLLIPNNALRDTIHEFMGEDWVAKKTVERGKSVKSTSAKDAQSTLRAKIDCYLQALSGKMGGLSLHLNDQGCCAFRYDGITVVLDVPSSIGVFCLYTRDLVPFLTDSMKDQILQLNVLQSHTRGGCLAVKTHDDGRQEVLFSYTDRICEVSSMEFTNILLNFVETAVILRRKLLDCVDEDVRRLQAGSQAQQSAPLV